MTCIRKASDILQCGSSRGLLEVLVFLVGFSSDCVIWYEVLMQNSRVNQPILQTSQVSRSLPYLDNGSPEARWWYIISWKMKDYANIICKWEKQSEHVLTSSAREWCVTGGKRERKRVWASVLFRVFVDIHLNRRPPSLSLSNRFVIKIKVSCSVNEKAHFTFK